MKFLAALLSAVFIVSPFAKAFAECESEAGTVIRRYLSKRGVVVERFVRIEVRSLTQGSNWQRYAVVATVLTSEGKMRPMRFVMSSPFICDDMSIESVH